MRLLPSSLCSQKGKLEPLRKPRAAQDCHSSALRICSAGELGSRSGPAESSRSESGRQGKVAGGSMRMERFHRGHIVWILGLVLVSSGQGARADGNRVYRPCQDATVKKGDGFTFALVSAQNSSFYYRNAQLSPCDKRLTGLNSGQMALFRPKVDEISLLIINISQFNPEYYGGYGVVFAGSHYAAVSKPVFLANGSYHVNSLSLVLDFDKGRLVNLLWKTDDCAACKGRNATFVCLRGGQCAIRTQYCNSDPKTKVDCSVTIQLAFSGTDKYDEPLTSWYQLSRTRQYSLYSLYSNLRSTLRSQYHMIF